MRRPPLACTALLALAGLHLAACGPEAEDWTLTAAGGAQLQLDPLDGSFELREPGGAVRLRRAFAEVEVGEPGAFEPRRFRTTGRCVRSAERTQGSDVLGQAERLVLECRDQEGAPDLVWTLSVYREGDFFTAALEAVNHGSEPLVLARLVPAQVEAERDGGLFVGAAPGSTRVLEDGSFFLFDFFADLVPGDLAEQPETVALGMVHGYQRGYSISNWNHAVYDPASGRAFVAGALDFERSSPMCNLAHRPEAVAPEGGRTPYAFWSVDFPYLPGGKPLPAGAALQAGPVWFTPAALPLPALEEWAASVGRYNDIRLWTERGADHRIPTGWNSWTGSGSSGGYGASIDQQLMLDNLAAMAAEFRDFGGEWFQIDDGYEPTYGDWDWNPERFPDGAAAMATHIRDAGLLPGVWIAAFQVDESSETYRQHQADGWFPERIPLMGGDKPVIDPTHPEVAAWLTDRFRRIRADGYRWIKTDFMYWALGAARYHDPAATREEAYRQGLAAIRAGLDAGAAEAGGNSGDVFWLSVAIPGPNLGFADSLRPNLDTMPAWDTLDPTQGRKQAQGFKPTVRMMARRYYFQNRIFQLNHDMIFFRSYPDPAIPPITAEESRCLLTAIALSGSVAKLGEKLVEMAPEWIDGYRRVIPIYGHAARPLDLFDREFPEVWHLSVVPSAGLNTGGDGPAYDVLALFNWGENVDLSATPFAPLPDQARTLSVPLEDLGLDPLADYAAREFWSGEVLPQVRGRLERSLPAHSVQVFALRPRQSRPMYLGGNRHLLQGAVEIAGLDWDAAQRRLALQLDAAPGSARAPFEHRLDFLLPAGWSLRQATLPQAAAGSLTTQVDGEVLSVRFRVEQRQVAELDLLFDGP